VQYYSTISNSSWLQKDSELNHRKAKKLEAKKFESSCIRKKEEKKAENSQRLVVTVLSISRAGSRFEPKKDILLLKFSKAIFYCLIGSRAHGV